LLYLHNYPCTIHETQRRNCQAQKAHEAELKRLGVELL